MICVLFLVGYGQAFVQGEGSVFYKSCMYKCGRSERRIVYRVHPDFICPGRFYLT